MFDLYFWLNRLVSTSLWCKEPRYTNSSMGIFLV